MARTEAVQEGGWNMLTDGSSCAAVESVVRRRSCSSFFLLSPMFFFIIAFSRRALPRATPRRRLIFTTLSGACTPLSPLRHYTPPLHAAAASQYHYFLFMPCLLCMPQKVLKK